MSTQENVEIVKDFFAAIGRGDKQGLPKKLSGSFRARTGRLPAHTAETWDWRICFSRLPKWWKLHSQWQHASAILALRRVRLDQSDVKSIRYELDVQHAAFFH